MAAALFQSPSHTSTDGMDVVVTPADLDARWRDALECLFTELRAHYYAAPAPPPQPGAGPTTNQLFHAVDWPMAATRGKYRLACAAFPMEAVHLARAHADLDTLLKAVQPGQLRVPAVVSDVEVARDPLLALLAEVGRLRETERRLGRPGLPYHALSTESAQPAHGHTFVSAAAVGRLVAALREARERGGPSIADAEQRADFVRLLRQLPGVYAALQEWQVACRRLLAVAVNLAVPWQDVLQTWSDVWASQLNRVGDQPHRLLELACEGHVMVCTQCTSKVVANSGVACKGKQLATWCVDCRLKQAGDADFCAWMSARFPDQPALVAWMRSRVATVAPDDEESPLAAILAAISPYPGDFL